MKKIIFIGFLLLILFGCLYQFDEEKDSLVAAFGANKSWGIIKLLIYVGADPNAHGNRDMPPLHYAVQDGDLDMIDFLIEKGADVNLKASFYGLGYGVELSPLMVAYVDRPDNLEVIKNLLDAGADPNELISNADSIISYKQYELLDVLLTAGAEADIFAEFATLHEDTEALKIIASHVHTMTTEQGIEDIERTASFETNQNDLHSFLTYLQKGESPYNHVKIGDSLEELGNKSGVLIESDIKEIGRTIYSEEHFLYGVSTEGPQRLKEITIFEEGLPPFKAADIQDFWGTPDKVFDDMVEYSESNLFIRFFINTETQEINQLMVYEKEL